jgi:hypothetical protein
MKAPLKCVAEVGDMHAFGRVSTAVGFQASAAE